MIHDSIEFHNVAELREATAGLRLQRVPEDVRLTLNEKAQVRMLSPAGVEIRFVSSGDEVAVTLSCPEGSAEVIPFWGGFQVRECFAIGEEPRTLKLGYPPLLRTLDREAAQLGPFAPQVCRLLCRGDGLHYHSVEGEGLRPPNAAELPQQRYLAYGTSITHGGAASHMHLTYVEQASRRIGADLINLGVGGSAYCEKSLADYMAGREDWDFATLCLSVNMIGGGFSVEEFRDRVTYMVEAMAGADEQRPVVCITILPYRGDCCRDQQDRHGEGVAAAFRDVLREAVASSAHPNLYLVEGADLLRDFDGLTVDLVHPGDHGMIQIGENLAGALAGIVKGHG